MWIVPSPTESGWIVFLVPMPGILLEVLPRSLQQSYPIQAKGLSSSLTDYCSEAQELADASQNFWGSFDLGFMGWFCLLKGGIVIIDSKALKIFCVLGRVSLSFAGGKAKTEKSS